MRFILYCISFLYFSLVFAQSQDRIEIPFTSEYQLIDILRFAEKEGINIIYSPTLLPSERRRIDAGQYSFPELLEPFRSLNIQTEYVGNSILIKSSKVPKRIIAGYIRDAKTGEALIGATIFLPNSESGTSTNDYGYFSIKPEPEDSLLVINFVGFYQKVDTIPSSGRISRKDYRLEEFTTELEKVEIHALDVNRNISSVVPGEKYLNYNTEYRVPYFLGEVDIIQKALLLPGIRTLGEDAAGINVRGGDIDQNLLLLDEAVIYNPNHFYGLISVFNPEAVNQVKIMKGFIPAKYGGRASSVIEVHQKEGNKYERSISGGLGLVSARVMTEGPIKKGVSSYLVSARQSLYDISVESFSDDALQSSSTSFQDVNVKLNWDTTPRNTFFLSLYYGNDRNRAGFDAIRRWGNRTATARWNHTYSRKLFANYSAVVSDYSYQITNPVEAASFIGRSDVRNYTLKLDHEFEQSPRSNFEFGGDIILHRLSPGERFPFDENSSLTEPVILDNEVGLETGVFVSHLFKLSPRVKVSYGIRGSSLTNIGPGTVYEYDPEQPKSSESHLDTMLYDNGEKMDQFIIPEPRLAINFGLRKDNSIKVAYSRTAQYIHLISNTSAPAPTDIWKLSDRHIEPVIGDQLSIGYYQNFANNTWETSVEGYYKYLENPVEYKNGADLLLNATPETELITGIGRAYGLETYIEKKSGMIQGWVSYTLSRSERKFESPFREESINNGEFFPDNQDKTHDLSVVLIHPKSENLSFSTSFNYSTGRPITFPSGKYEIGGVSVPYFGDRNQNRISDYHRLDLSVKWSPNAENFISRLKLKEYFWTFNIYNVYARRNAYSYFFRQSESDPNQTEVIKYSIFGTIIPSVTLNFRF